MVQILVIINMNVPDDYITYSRHFEITQLNFDFLDFIKAQDSIEGETRRHLQAGFKPLRNLNFNNGNFMDEYIYLFMLLLVIGLFHAVFRLLIRNRKFKEDTYTKRIVDFFKNILEFKLYIYLIFYTSLMTMTICWNQILGTDFSTVVNGIGYIIAIIWVIGIILLTALPTYLARVLAGSNKVVNGAVTEETLIENPKFIDIMRSSFVYGLKNTKASAYYYAMFLTRRILLAIVIVSFINLPEAQLIFFLLINIAYTGYLAFVRPFEHLVHNVLALINELVIIAVGLIFFAFITDGDENTDASTVIIVILIIDQAIVCLLGGLIYELYLIWVVMR